MNKSTPANSQSVMTLRNKEEYNNNWCWLFYLWL